MGRSPAVSRVRYRRDDGTIGAIHGLTTRPRPPTTTTSCGTGNPCPIMASMAGEDETVPPLSAMSFSVLAHPG